MNERGRGAQPVQDSSAPLSAVAGPSGLADACGGAPVPAGAPPDPWERGGEPSGRTKWRYGVKVTLAQREWLKSAARAQGVTVETITTRLLSLALEISGCPAPGVVR